MIKATLKKSAKPPVVDVEATVEPPSGGETAGAAPAPSGGGLEDTLLAGRSGKEKCGAEGAPAGAVATRPVSATPVAAGAAARSQIYVPDGFEGEFDSSDLKFPQLKIVQGSGPLAAQFDQGSLVYADQELFPPPSMKEGVTNPSLRFVPIAVKKQFRESLTPEQVAEGEMPRVVDTLAEVEALGGTTLWLGGQKPSWSPSGRCLFLIEKPEGSDHPGFALDLDGKQFAVAVFYAAGSSYNHVVKVLHNTAQTALLVPVCGPDGKPAVDQRGRVHKRPLLWKCFWTFSWGKKQVGNFQVYQPSLRLLAKEETGSDVRDYIANFVGSTATAGEALAGE